MISVLSAILPVFLVAGAAYAVRRRFDLDVRTLSTLNLYLFIPCLVFSGLSRRVIAWEVFGRFAAAIVLLTLALTLILEVVARVRRVSGPERSAFLLTMFPNVGNFGLPVVVFAFGEEESLPLAVIVLVCASFLQNSYGIYLAQRSRHGVFAALKRMLCFPMIYAFFTALIMQRLGVRLPADSSLMRAIDLAADAAIPAQLMVLGIKLAETRLDTSVNVFAAVAIRLCLTPIVALAAARLAGLGGIEAKVLVLQVSGPIAVGMAVFGVQFDLKPRFLASAVSWSFLLSIVSVSVLLYVLLRVPL